MTTPRFRFYPKRSTVTETVSATVSVIHYSPATPEQELAKWEQVLETLGDQEPASPQEALAREVVRKRLKDLRKQTGKKGSPS